MATDKKRMAAILRGIETRTVTRPVPGRFHYAAVKGLPRACVWKPTILMDNLANDDDSGPSSRPTKGQVMCTTMIRRSWDRLKAREMITAGPYPDERPVVLISISHGRHNLWQRARR